MPTTVDNTDYGVASGLADAFGGWATNRGARFDKEGALALQNKREAETAAQLMQTKNRQERGDYYMDRMNQPEMSLSQAFEGNPTDFEAETAVQETEVPLSMAQLAENDAFSGLAGRAYEGTSSAEPYARQGGVKVNKVSAMDPFLTEEQMQQSQVAGLEQGNRTNIGNQLVEAGYTPGTPEYEQAMRTYMAKAGTTVNVGDGSTTKFEPGKAKEHQVKLYTYGDRILTSSDEITAMEEAISSKNLPEGVMLQIQSVLSGNAATSTLASNESRQFMQSARNIINAILRRESGAVISDQEFANARAQYLPMPGDDPETLRRKRRNREMNGANYLKLAGEGAREYRDANKAEWDANNPLPAEPEASAGLGGAVPPPASMGNAAEVEAMFVQAVNDANGDPEKIAYAKKMYEDYMSRSE